MVRCARREESRRGGEQERRRGGEEISDFRFERGNAGEAAREIEGEKKNDGMGCGVVVGGVAAEKRMICAVRRLESAGAG